MLITKNQLITLDDCIDEHQFCADWARHNHCFRNPEPLLLFCKKSCGNCGPCRDESSNCPKRFSYLACVGNANFAFRECKAVCELCKPGRCSMNLELANAKISEVYILQTKNEAEYMQRWRSKLFFVLGQ